MSAVALGRHRHAHHLGRALGSTLALLAVVAATIGLGLSLRGDGGEVVRTAGVSPTDAIGTWLEVNRHEVFPGATGPYLGACPATSAEVLIGLCSSLSEDLGDVRIHRVGVYATDWGADVLLESTPAGWTVTAVSRWPELGTRYDGAPWSPVTAITGWWFDRAEARFGAGAVHLHGCSDAEGAMETGQPLLCSTLVERSDDGARRVYDSGLVGEDPVVRIEVERRTDHTWTVTSVTPAP